MKVLFGASHLIDSQSIQSKIVSEHEYTQKYLFQKNSDSLIHVGPMLTERFDDSDVGDIVMLVTLCW